MANTGEKDDNQSQFFLTLGDTKELNGRNTMFGRVEGNTIFNLVKMGEADLTEAEDSETPLYPTQIKSTEILVSPFEDMVKRVRIAERTKREDRPLPKKKAKKKTGKQMLSFGDEEAGADEGPLVRAAKFNPKLVQGAADPIPRPSGPSPLRAATKSSKASAAQTTTTTALPKPIPKPAAPVDPGPSASPCPPPSSEPEQTTLARTTAQIDALKTSLKRTHALPPSDTPSQQNTSSSNLIPEGATRGLKRKAASGDTTASRALRDFNAFKARLDAASSAPKVSKGGKESGGAAVHGPNSTERVSVEQEAEPEKNGQDEEEEQEPCELHFVPGCQSCRKWDALDASTTRSTHSARNAHNTKPTNGDEEEEPPEGLMTHSLSFARDRLGKDLEWKRSNEKELVVIDPREREKEILKGRGGKGGRERGRGR